MSIIRKRSASQKAYIPADARDNQYILAEFELSEQLLLTLPDAICKKGMISYSPIYQHIAQLLFQLSESYHITNSLLVANDKLVRVRYGQEMHSWQTPQQIVFYYDPIKHNVQNAIFDENIQARKISLVFLSAGDERRVNAAKFHKQVNSLLLDFAEKISLPITKIKVRDHQHLTYDIFSKDKGESGSQAHKFRPVAKRYNSQDVTLPSEHSSMTYAVINLNMHHRLTSLVDIDINSADAYNPLYTFLTDTFSQVAKRYNLNNGALNANGLTPIVRFSEQETIATQGELQMLGYNPKQCPCGIISKWNAEKLVETVQFIFVATHVDGVEPNQAKFVNQIEQAMHLFAKALQLETDKDELTMRFHQHIAYHLSPV